MQLRQQEAALHRMKAQQRRDGRARGAEVVNGSKRLDAEFLACDYVLFELALQDPDRADLNEWLLECKVAYGKRAAFREENIPAALGVKHGKTVQHVRAILKKVEYALSALSSFRVSS